jgi:Planctomycete cytochrome C
MPTPYHTPSSQNVSRPPEMEFYPLSIRLVTARSSTLSRWMSYLNHMFPMMWILAFVLVFSAPRVLSAEPEQKDPAPVSYYKEIRPLFQQHCQGCHQPAKPLGGYVMTSHAGLFKIADHERPGVVPGQPGQSFLLAQVQNQ